MQLVNRDSLIVTAKQTFVDWLKSIPDLEMPDATLDDVNDPKTILLIPEVMNEIAALRYLSKVKPALARKFFGDWYLDESTWPDLEKMPFDHWFAVEYQSMIFDMVVGKVLDKDEENELTEQSLGAIRGSTKR